jgi:hypothetical protein
MGVLDVVNILARLYFIAACIKEVWKIAIGLILTPILLSSPLSIIWLWSLNQRCKFNQRKQIKISLTLKDVNRLQIHLATNVLLLQILGLRVFSFGRLQAWLWVTPTGGVQVTILLTLIAFDWCMRPLDNGWWKNAV